MMRPMILNSTMLRPSMMSAAERRAGRFMRAPDGHEGDVAPAGEPVAPEAAPVEPSDDTALGTAATSEADKPEGGKPSDDGGEADKPKEGEDAESGGEEKPAGAPEAYDLKAPEGMDFDSEAMALAEPVMRELNLDNAQAQKLVDVYSQMAPKFGERLVAQQQAAIVAERKAWLEEAKADPEIGGANWDASIAASAKALDRLGAPAGSPFRDLLNVTGLGNHPEMVRILANAGKAIGEDPDFISSSGGHQPKADAAETLYPNDKPKGA